MRRRYRYFIYIIILGFLYSEYTISKIDNESRIRHIAQCFLDYKKLIHTQALENHLKYTIKGIEFLKCPRENIIHAYIVKIKPKGFLVISPKLDHASIIAYSFRHNWQSGLPKDHVLYQLLTLDENHRTKNFDRLSAQGYQINIANLQTSFNLENVEDFTFHQWPKEGSTKTGGWIETTWHQSAPYNDLCPFDTPLDSVRSAVGCVALSMAQIVHYHAYLPSLNFEEGDRYTYRGITVDQDSSEYGFPGFKTLNGYMKRIKEKFNRNIELDSRDIAALCFACGVSTEMNYSENKSWVYPPYSVIEKAFTDKMYYHTADYKPYTIDEFFEFDDVLIENMINGLPAILILGNHAITADGYNTNGFYHLNFGFGDTYPDSITDVWYNINDNWKDTYKGLHGGVLDIKSRPQKWNLQIKSRETIRLANECVGVASGRELFYIINSGLEPISIDHIIPSANFYYLVPQKPYFPKEHIIINPNDSTSVFIWYIPDTLGAIYGKLQIFAAYHTDYYHEKKYIDIDLFGYGVPGTVIREGTVYGIWNKDLSPYFIRGNVSINKGEKLIIEAGTEIIFDGPYAFNIEKGAQLVAKGTENDSIYFIANKTDINWRGLVFKDSGYDDTLAYCVVSGVNPMGPTLSIGGGMSLIGSSPAIMHSRFNKNRSANSGGGMYLQNSKASINNSRFEQNTSSMNGGGIFISAGSSPNISNVEILNNLAQGDGGGIYCSESEINLSNVTIGKNYARNRGGGIYCAGESYLYFDSKNRCNIYLNNADSAGKDLYNASSQRINVVLDMFTALEPTDALAYPLDKFTFDILKMPIDLAMTTESVLSQNYPNPFNPSTKITFILPKSEKVTIEIYNIIGQKIKTLLNRQMPAGHHKIKFDAQDLSSGVYLYRIKAGAWSDVKKMVMIR